MKNDTPEHRLQHWVIEMLDRIILTDVPHHWTGIDHSVKMTNQSDQAKMNFENHRKFMGIKPHHLDTYVYQAPIFAQIELKFAASEDAARKALTTGQMDTMVVLERQKCPHGFAWSIRSYYDVLRRIGFRLHGNAENIVAEIEARHAAAHVGAHIKRAAPPKTRTHKPRAAKPSKAHLRKVAQGRWF